MCLFRFTRSKPLRLQFISGTSSIRSLAGEYAAQRALESAINQTAIDSQTKDVIRRLEDLYNQRRE